MTSPLLHGFPDWARQSAESDISVYFASAVALPALATIGPLFVGGIPSLYLAYGGSGVRNRIQCSFYADAAATQLIDQDAITVGQNGAFTGYITVYGPWVTFTFEADSYPQTYNARVAMAPAARAATGANASAGQMLLGAPLNVAAGTNVDVISSITWRGSAVLYTESPAAAGARIDLFHRRFDGSLILIYHGLDSGRETVELALQPSIVLARVMNPAGAARDFYFALNAKRQGD
jgi:hypothetical protein